MTNEGDCPRYGDVFESGLHAIRDCDFSGSVWIAVVPSFVHSVFFSKLVKDRILWNMQNKGNCGSQDMEWETLFPIVCWLLWKNRNIYVFSQNHSYKQELLDTDVTWDRSYAMSFSNPCQPSQSATTKFWSPPDGGWVKLNIDRAMSMSGSNTSIGGVFRGHYTNWLRGYFMTIGRDTIFKVETRLCVAWEKGF